MILSSAKDSTGHVWIRLLAADGSSGWTSRRFQGEPARIVAPPVLQLSPHAPGEASFSPSDDEVTVPSARTSVTGGARIGRVSSLEQLKIPARLNPFLASWLQIQSSATSKWIAPSEIGCTWRPDRSTPDLERAAEALHLEGIVRSPFLGALGKRFDGLRPRPGQVPLHFNDIQSHSIAEATTAAQTWDHPKLFLRSTPSLVSFPGSAGTAFVFGRVGFALVAQGRPVVVDYQLADLDGDGKPELLLQLVSTYGDGYTTALWIVDGAASQNGNLRIAAETLDGSSGEPGGSTVDAQWWADTPNASARSTLWIARAQRARVEFAVIDYPRSTATAARNAYAVVADQFLSAEAAARSSILLSQKNSHRVHYFPWAADAAGAKSWAVGRLFRNRDDAVAWRKQSALPDNSLHQILLQAN